MREMAVKELPILRERGVCCGLPDVDEEWAEQTSALMKASNLEIFELGMWQFWSATR